MENHEESFWDERYSGEEFIYGTEPNNFFKEQIDRLKPGRLLMLGEGEGRNGVYAAKKGWSVDAVDFSEKAREKALKLAESQKTKINYVVNDLQDYVPKKNYYDVVGLIFLHLNEKTRENIYKKVIDSLKPGGTIIMEVYSKEQLGRNSGGPQNPEMLYSIEGIKNIFGGLKHKVLEQKIIYLTESSFHYGEASVIRFVGEK